VVKLVCQRQTKLEFQMGKRKLEMIETIISHNLPDELSGTYEAKGVFNKINNQFIAKSAN
jgi:hypothetical protein